MGIGDWGLGPIPNPQSPLEKYNFTIYNIYKTIIKQTNHILVFIKLKIKYLVLSLLNLYYNTNNNEIISIYIYNIYLQLLI